MPPPPCTLPLDPWRVVNSQEFMQLAYDHCSVSTYEQSEDDADPEAANGGDDDAAAPQHQA